jgi:hypothetical protein
LEAEVAQKKADLEAKEADDEKRR